jgi:hypothetical protein
VKKKRQKRLTILSQTFVKVFPADYAQDSSCYQKDKGRGGETTPTGPYVVRPMYIEMRVGMGNYEDDLPPIG